MTVIVGVDGCPVGWVAVVAHGSSVTRLVALSIAELIERLPSDALVAIDIPIGLTDIGPRPCDVPARRLLGPGRASSVFPAPIRPVLQARSYLEACAIRERIEGKRMSHQAFAIVPKIREVDALLQDRPELRTRVKEIHPEVCFALWNGGRAIASSKKRPEGKAARELLIEVWRPGVDAQLASRWSSSQVGRDDLNDAFAALWTAERIVAGTAMRIPEVVEVDATGLPMEMWA